MMTIEIKLSSPLNYNTGTIHLTVDEARQLRDELNKLFGPQGYVYPNQIPGVYGGIGTAGSLFPSAMGQCANEFLKEMQR